MGMFSREEVDTAFWQFHDALNLAARTTDWREFGKVLRPDATLYDCVKGRIGKREGIVREISSVMHQTGDTPWVRLNRYPVEDYYIDEERDWVWSLWWARFTDPGDGSNHQARMFVLLKYRGDGMFHYVETVYNPIDLEKAMDGWKAAKAQWDSTSEEYLAVLAAREAEARSMAPLKLDEQNPE